VAQSSSSATAPGHPAAAIQERCPPSRVLRDRLRAMAADLVASWRTDGQPRRTRSASGLRTVAADLVRRAGGGPDHVGWTMVTIVSEFWRERLSRIANGRRLLLLPDCPAARPVDEPQAERSAGVDGRGGGGARTCGPGCGLATIRAAALDSGWAVGSTRQAAGSIGSLLTGHYDGVLGLAKLDHLRKAFAMIPAFAIPAAAVPFEVVPPDGPPRDADTCAAALDAAAIDVDWVLGLLGVAGGGAGPVGDYLPLVREAAGLFTPPALEALAGTLGLERSFGLLPSSLHAEGGGEGQAGGPLAPLDAAAATAGDFLTRGGKFLRPFITLAVFDAVRADLARAGRAPPADSRLRDAARAAAVAIEVFHKASLVHDDIEDGDRVRYGRPTLHEQWGVPSAINTGDYLLGIGYRIVSALPGVDPATRADMVAMLAEAHVRLARGQGAELWWRDASDKGLSPGESLEMYALKTSPAFEAAIALGMRLAGGSPGEGAFVPRYARHVGAGFQVLNDLKDWEGDLENNRRAAGDLLGGRPTLMWALALDCLGDEDRDRLRFLAESAGRPDADEGVVSGCVAQVRVLYERAGVFRRAGEIVGDQRRLALAAAAECKLPGLRDVLEFLLDLAVPEGSIPEPAESPAIPDAGRSRPQ